MTVPSSPARRPPKRPRPWPVPRVAFADAGLTAADVVARLAERRPTPWVDPLPPGLVVPHGLPSSHGTVPHDVADARVLVTFVHQDPGASQVLLWANRLTDETNPTETLLERLPGTDLWLGCFAVPADWRASYCFLPVSEGEVAPWATGDHVALRRVLDRGLRDPRNPRTSTNRAGITQSVVEGPAAPRPAWTVGEGVTSPGQLRAYEVEGRSLWVHQPDGADDRTPLPLLVVMDGETWLERQHLERWLVAGTTAGFLPAYRTLYVSSGGQDQRWRDLGSGGDGVAELCDVLVPWVRAHFATSPGARAVTVAGQSLGGLAVLRAALERPEVVGNAVSQSASLWQTVPQVPTGTTSRIHLTHGAQEWVLAGPHRDLAAELVAAGVDVRAASHQGGHDYAWWRVALLDGLAWLHATRR